MTIVTWDSVNKGDEVVLSNGNLTARVPTISNSVKASIGRSTGKWYWEIALQSAGSSMIGIASENAPMNSINYNTANVRYLSFNGQRYPSGGLYGTTYASGDTIGLALNLDNGTLTFFKNGISGGIAFSNIGGMGEVFPAASSGSSSGSSPSTYAANFGVTPFKYDIPNGYKPYNFENVNKTLILSENNSYTHDDTEWENIGTLPTDLEERKIFYETYGMEIITAEQAKQLKTALPNGKGKISVMKL